MTRSQTTRPSSAKDEAFTFVLAHGQNIILWEECEFIWGPRSLIHDTATHEEVRLSCDQCFLIFAYFLRKQLVIFGVQGKISTPSQEIRNFQVRHSFDFGPDRRYTVEATVIGGMHNCVQQSFEVVLDQEESDQELQLFEKSVQQLTDEFTLKGSLETMKRFIASSAS